MRCSARGGRHDEAVEALGGATAVEPTLAIANSKRAASFLAMRRLLEAERCYGEALAIDPDLVTAGPALAAALIMMSLLDEALSEAQSGLDSNPSPAYALLISELAPRTRRGLGNRPAFQGK